MTIKPLNQFNAIFSESAKRNLSGNEQLILLHVNNQFNKAHWTETIQLTDKELMALLKQYDSNGKPLSQETLRRAKQRLKQFGLIDFNSGVGKKSTEYKLVKLYRAPVDTPDTSLLLSLKPTKQEDVKTFQDFFKKNKKNAHARSNNKIIDERAGYFGVSLDPQLQYLWETNTNDRNRREDGSLTDYQYCELARLQEKFGVEKLKAAMEKSLEFPNSGIGNVKRSLEKINEVKASGVHKASDDYANNW